MSTPTAPVIRLRPKATNGTLEFWWLPPVSDGGSPITGYTIEIPNVYVDTVGPSVEYYKIVGLTNGVPYTAQIYAINANGNGAVATFRTVEPGNPPGPTQTQSATRSTATSATFSWTAPASDGGATIGWNVVAAYPLDSSGAVIRRNVLGNETSLMIPDLSGTTVYNALVRARNDPGYSPRTVYLAPLVYGTIPTDISGLQLWLDAADLTTLFTDAGAATQSSLETSQILRWNDKSGLGRDMSGVAFARRLATGLNGNRYPCMQFTGTSFEAATASYSNHNAITVFLVGQMANLAVTDQRFLTADSILLILKLETSKGTNFLFAADGSNDFSAISGAFISATYVDAVDTKTEVYNPTYASYTIARPNDSNFNTSTVLRIGQTSADVRISELLIWDRALSTGERTLIANYLQQKWGFPVFMPTPVVYLVAADVTGGDTTWTDRSGNGWDATLAGGTSAKNGANALALDGSTYWTFGDIGVQTNFSMSVWFKRTAAIGTGGAIIAEAYTGGNYVNMAIYGGDYGASDTQFTGGFFDSSWRVTAAQEFPLNTWVQMTTTWDGNDTKTYINGTLQDTITWAGQSAQSTGLGYNIGKRWDNPDYVTGDLGEIRIDGVALTAAQVTSYYNSTSGTYV